MLSHSELVEGDPQVRLAAAQRRPRAGDRLADRRGVDYTLIGDHATRAAVVVYRGEKAGALGLTFGRQDGGLRLVALEAPDRPSNAPAPPLPTLPVATHPSPSRHPSRPRRRRPARPPPQRGRPTADPTRRDGATPACAGDRRGEPWPPSPRSRVAGLRAARRRRGAWGAPTGGRGPPSGAQLTPGGWQSRTVASPTGWCGVRARTRLVSR